MGEGLWPLALPPEESLVLAISLDLPRTHPTGLIFLDESGSISNDRFFAVGCLKISEPSDLTRSIQRLRDQWHWYQEIHFTDLTHGALPFYNAVLSEVSRLRMTFACFVADRSVDDPILRFGSSWKAYEALAEQLLAGNIGRREVVTVLADRYSTPATVVFERDVKREVNRRFDRLAIASVCRLDSKSADALQVVDLLTGAVTFEFRQRAGLAGMNSPKAQLARSLRAHCSAGTFCNGFKTRAGNATSFRVNVAFYRARDARRLLPGPGFGGVPIV